MTSYLRSFVLPSVNFSAIPAPAPGPLPSGRRRHGVGGTRMTVSFVRTAAKSDSSVVFDPELSRWESHRQHARARALRYTSRGTEEPPACRVGAALLVNPPRRSPLGASSPFRIEPAQDVDRSVARHDRVDVFVVPELHRGLRPARDVALGEEFLHRAPREDCNAPSAATCFTQEFVAIPNSPNARSRFAPEAG